MLTWNTACLDWEDRIVNQRPLVPDLPLFEDEKLQALRIFKRLRLPDVSGLPTMEETCGEWLFQIVAAVFGSLDREAGRRMIREFFLLIPKKNSKTSSAAAIMVVAAIMNDRPSAEFLLIAPTKQIAQIAFNQAAGLIEADKSLKDLFYIQSHRLWITNRNTKAKILIKAADTDVITGSKATGILVDETHEFAKMSRAEQIFVEVRGSLSARPEGFMIQITTQSKTPPSGVFKQELMIARDVRDGKMNLPLLPILYELPENVAANGGWKREATWPMVNPNLGRSVDPLYLRDQLITAERKGSGALALLASQHFNVEIGLSLKTDAWVGADYWEQNADETILSLDDLLDRCEVVCVGIDGGGLDDLLGIAVLGREKDTRRWLLWSHAWAHECVLRLRQEIAPTLRDFEQEGSLTIIQDSSTEDVKEVAEIVDKIYRLRLLPKDKAIGVDPAGTNAIVDELVIRKFSVETEGVTGMVAGVRQGWTLNNAILTLERKLAANELKHGGTLLMNWALGNAKVEPAGNAIKITKQAAGTAKIDPLVALFDAAAMMLLNPKAAGPATARAWVI